jgi:hypothetical protein
MTTESKGILTIAIGKKYVKQAMYLAYSCMLNAPHTLRAVITDSPDTLSNFYDIIIPYHDNDDPFSIKTRLFELSPFQKTLYLDADSLVFHPIDDYWNYLDRNHYVYEGAKLTAGEWYFDIKKICQTIHASWIPKFNSGMLLFDKSDNARQIFNTANYYFNNYQKEGIDIPYFRGKNYPDEPAFAVAFAKHSIEPVNDYGRFSRTLIEANHIQINIKKRTAKFFKNGRMTHPLVVHFCGRKGGLYYLREKLRLTLHFFTFLR